MNNHLAYKQKRLSLGISIDEAAQKTKIRGAYLKAIEEGDFAQLPGSFFAKSYIRDYALFLTIPAEPLLLEYDRFYSNSMVYSPSESMNELSMPDKPSDAEIAELIAYETNFPKKRVVKLIVFSLAIGLTILTAIALISYYPLPLTKPKNDVQIVVPEITPVKNTIATVDVNMATLRIDPHLDAEPVTWAARGVTFVVKDTFVEEDTGKKWYKVTTSDGKDCWIADKVVTISN